MNTQFASFAFLFLDIFSFYESSSPKHTSIDQMLTRRRPYSHVSICCLPFHKLRNRANPPGPPRERPFKEPKTLKTARRRALTQTSENDSNQGRVGPNPQLKSRLMQLPREIRNQIWMETVGGMTLYLTITNGHLCQRVPLAMPSEELKKGLLSLALTCRQM